MKRSAAVVGAALVVLVHAVGVAVAHPHVWVTFRSEILYAADGRMSGVRHAWTFDDMFSAYALQGIAHARKGFYTREELRSLAEVNMTSLKEYDYFTFAKADGRTAAFSGPVDYWLEYKDPSLTLHFTLPLKTPVAARAVAIDIYDPSIFVDFAFATDRPATLVGAPQGCRLALERPREPTAAEQQRLSGLDAVPLDKSDTWGATFANKIRVTCP
ncbi:DUF1007 family protein [Rhodoplanes sp. TEM]|uniref:DUF1007 family protein n=1 Tax=Rhodoplanes tepidamans TaxID=200616 RepID=A0ABT5JCU4_RHOTP|nr:MULTISPECIES: DUF1007 family protein [Rhodoplanes]MDC7787312.1 DUF1007 family protein [Rhodoplanes tepidamans]MDC7986898.1 DUF1007 family protein [Rhodoplanes sp. TEM]MDQ0358223.1 ABC-type uncharacterized transport system substrate-binding protein [Rhodoplanes tepidamans]